MMSENIRSTEQLIGSSDWDIAGDIDKDQVWEHVISRRCTLCQAADGRWDADNEWVGLAEIVARTCRPGCADLYCWEDAFLLLMCVCVKIIESSFSGVLNRCLYVNNWATRPLLGTYAHLLTPGQFELLLNRPGCSSHWWHQQGHSAKIAWFFQKKVQTCISGHV